MQTTERYMEVNKSTRVRGTMYLRYSFAVFAFTFFDSRLLGTCDQLSKRRDLKLRAKHLSGNTIERAKLFLKKVCNIDANTIETLPWSSLIFVENVRDCIVHTSGE